MPLLVKCSYSKRDILGRVLGLFVNMVMPQTTVRFLNGIVFLDGWVLFSLGCGIFGLCPTVKWQL